MLVAMANQLADTLAREHTEAAINTLVEVMTDKPRIDDETGEISYGAKPGERVSAAKEILARGHGMPTQAIISLPARPRAADQLAAMSDADLLAAIGAARIARQRALPALEAELINAEDDPLCA